jgi:hypothetical protein
MCRYTVFQHWTSIDLALPTIYIAWVSRCVIFFTRHWLRHLDCERHLYRVLQRDYLLPDILPGYVSEIQTSLGRL